MAICGIILIIFIIIITIVIAIGWASWKVNIEMTRDNAPVCEKGNFIKFKKEFVKYNWGIHNERYFTYMFFIESMFDYKSNSELHAGITCFNGKGMILSPWNMLLVFIFLYRYQRNNIIERVSFDY